MKWRNKGEEFKELGQIIESTKKILIFGAGVYGIKLYNQIKDKLSVIGFIDNNVVKQKSDLFGLKVYSLEEVTELEKNYIIIVAISDEKSRKDVFESLISSGFQIDENLFSLSRFLTIYYAFIENKLYIESCAMSVTQKCSLNCEKCSILTPYIKGAKHYELDILKNNIDLLFNAIDFLGALTLIGGEAFLYPYLYDIVLYIGEKYRDRMNNFIIISNGMVVPSQELIKSFKKFNINIIISDYTKALPHIKKHVQEFIEVLRDSNVSYSVYETSYWIDFGYDNPKIKQYSEEQLTNFFDSCKMPCRLIEDGKLYYCANSKYAINAGLLDRDYNNEFDLKSFKESEMFYLLEFDKGFNECGYIELCKGCNGYLSINHNYIEVAKQVNKK